MNNDLRQQILVSLRAEGVGEADKAREAMAHIVAEIQRMTKGFVEASSQGDDLTKSLAAFKREVMSLGGQLKFFGDIAKGAEGDLVKLDVGLNQLQVTAIKFGDGLRSQHDKNAKAAETAEQKEAARLERLLANYDKFLEKQAVDDAKAATQKADLLTKEIQAEIQAADRIQAEKDAAALKEAERLAKLATDHDKFLERETATNAAAELKEAERLAKLAADHEKYLAKETAADDAAALKEAERLAKLIAKHEASEAKKTSVDEAAALKEAERLARLAADHEKYLDREAVAERKTIAEIAAARASLSQQRRDSLDAAFVGMQNEALKTQRIMTGFGTAVDHSHDKADKFGYAMLNVSHAFQDLQYGMGAVLNNIPLIMTSLGFGPGAAGAVMAMGVAVEMLRGQLGSLGAALGYADDPAKKLGATIDEVKAKIAAIDGKAFKFAVDFQDLAEAEARLKRLTKLKSLIEGTSETGGEKALSQVAQDLTTNAAGGSDALQKAVGDIEATRGVDHASPIDVNIARNAQKQVDKLTKMREGQNFITQAGTDLLIWDMTRRRDEAQKRVSEARGGFVDEEVGKFLAGDPDAIQRMKGRVQDFPGAFTPAGGKAIAAMPGTPEALEAAKKKDLVAQQTVALDLANVEDHEKWKTWNAREKAKKKTADDAKARERDQEVKKQANLFGGEFDDQKGSGSLDAAILGRAARGQTTGQIQGDLSTTMRGQLAGKVPPDLVDDVADAIVKKAVDKVRAEVAAAGGGAGGVRAVAGERADKLDRAADLAAGRQGKQQAGAMEAGMAQDIFRQAGGQLNEAGAMAAAHRAMQAMKGGANQQQAMWQGMMATLEDVAADALRTQMQLNGIHGRINGLQGQVRRNRAQRPGLLPQFPQ